MGWSAFTVSGALRNWVYLPYFASEITELDSALPRLQTCRVYFTMDQVNDLVRKTRVRRSDSGWPPHSDFVTTLTRETSDSTSVISLFADDSVAMGYSHACPNVRLLHLRAWVSRLSLSHLCLILKSYQPEIEKNLAYAYLEPCRH